MSDVGKELIEKWEGIVRESGDAHTECDYENCLRRILIFSERGRRLQAVHTEPH